MWQYFVLIAGLCILQSLPTSGFWWPKTTTETPRTQVLQQIPLTYFRTYTYQPLTGGPFGVPLFGFGAAQTPLLSGRPYDPYAVTSYAAARRHDVAAPATGYKPDVTPPSLAISTTTPVPSTTTTTTTTTPAPTTTTTTTTTSTSPPPPSSSTESGTVASSLRFGEYNSEYPTYTRRVNNFYNARPQYPYPDYFNYQQPNTLSEKSGSRIQFVPCMCPVSMPSMSAMSGLGMSSATSTDRDRPVSISISSSQPVVGVKGDVPSLQARHIDSEEADLDEMDDEDEEDQAAAADASSSAEADDVAVVTKLTLEPQYTTPAVESNSVV
ncbi:cell wall protein DAN4 [Drosophila grimshawi]|uniref:GH17859 n=1 Tax=Drosophila grimshawi TaxID=7222 RepID=B4JX05_DROGR|nr:cell wall protein DAN4 [Drosophila grimshawi]EDV95281.1 GH17859 [Drosophila grimshawi]